MNKKVLAIYYSQTGQLRHIVDSFTAPLIAAGNNVEKVQVKLVNDYPFPWTGRNFYGVMPDCVFEVPAQLEPLDLQQQQYDLVILGYQPWFLWPSIPANSILHSAEFKAIIKDTPVIMVGEARNMWLNAYDRIRQKLKDSGAKLVGNIALVDRHVNIISFVTIFHWMLGGKKDRYLNLFPKPGVSDEDIAHASVFGATVAARLAENNWENLQSELLSQNAVLVKYPLMLLETTAIPTYVKWARFINKQSDPGPWLVAFKYYIYIALFLGAPVLLTLDALFIRPFSSKRIKIKTENYLQVN